MKTYAILTDSFLDMPATTRRKRVSITTYIILLKIIFVPAYYRYLHGKPVLVSSILGMIMPVHAIHASIFRSNWAITGFLFQVPTTLPI